MSTPQDHTLLLAAATLTVIIVLVALKKRSSSNWGFKDVVKNPGYWKGVSHARQDVEAAIRAAKGWSDEKVASETRQFVLDAVSSREAWGQARILRELGKRTHPTVLELLREPSLYNQLVKPTGNNVLPEAPFNRACDLLGDSPPDTAVDVLAPFLSDPSDEIRKDSALSIAKTGAPAIVPLVKKAFSDADEYVRSYALMGLEFSLNRSRLAGSERAELFPAVLDLLQKGNNADKAADILYRLDEARATDFFLSHEVFAVDSPILNYVLETLADARVSVPRDRLQALIACLEAKEMKSQARALGKALELLGQQQLEADRAFLSARTTHLNARVAKGALAGLLYSFGLAGFEQRIWDSEKHSGYDALSPHQKFYSAVFRCDAEINNGGLAQYFVNCGGDHWHDAVAGFKEMGFKERLGVLNEAVSMFGIDGPAIHQDARRKQLSKLYKRNDACFEALESRYYKSSEIVQVLLFQFVLDNPESFR